MAKSKPSRMCPRRQKSEPLETSTPNSQLFEAGRNPTVSARMNFCVDPSKVIFFENRCHSWIQAIRFWAFLRRLKSRIIATRSKPKSRPDHSQAPAHSINTPKIPPEEMTEAILDLIRLIQSIYFSKEYSSRCSELKTSSVLIQYRPFMGEDNIIRYGTRLQRSTELSENQRFPIILPSNSFFSRLLIRDVHECRNVHSGGVARTLHVLRQDYLVIHARKLTHQLAAACPTCKIFHSKAALTTVRATTQRACRDNMGAIFPQP